MDGKKEVKAGLGYTVGNIFIKGLAFISLPVFSRIMTPEQFGIYNTYMAYEAIIAIILGLGLYSSIKNAKFDYGDNLDKYVSTVLWITTFPLFTLIIISAVFSDCISSILGLPMVFIFLLLLQSYGSAMLSISNTRLSLNYSYKKYICFAAFNTILNVTLSVILIITVFDLKREYGRIIGSAVPLIIIAAYIFISYQKKGKFQFDRGMAKYAASIGFPLIWHYLSQQVQNQFDRIAITNLIGASATGIYSFSYSIAVVFEVIFYSIENVWGIWMFSRMESKEYIHIRKISKGYMNLMAFIAILMLIGSKEVIMVMGEYEYWKGDTIFVPILIGVFLLYLYTIPVSVEYYFKETRYIAMMTATAAIVNIVTNYLFIPMFGYVAAAYTTMLSYGVQFASHWFISKKILNDHGIAYIYSLKDIMFVFLTVCSVGVIVLILNPYPIIKYVFFILLLLCYVALKREELIKGFTLFVSSVFVKK